MTAQKMLSHLRAHGCKVGGVTRGEHGLLWYEKDSPPRTTPALNVPPHRVIDTSGAGDVFHGAYVWSYLTPPQAKLGGALPLCVGRLGLQDPEARQRSRPADARSDIEKVTREFGDQVLEARPA